MNRIILTASVLLQLACLPSELCAQAQTEAAKAKPSTVTGRVLAKGIPARNATVILLPEQPADSQARYSLPRGQTDENGIYKITGLSAGKYRIAASLGKVSFLSDASFFVQDGTSFNVGEGEIIENMDLELKRGGVITGRVTCSNRPLVEEVVQLLRLDQDGKPRNFTYDLIHMGRTDDRGRYRIYGLPGGRYLVGVGIAKIEGININGGNWSSNARRTFHPDVNEQSEAKIIEVADGSEAADVDIAVAEVDKTYSINGRVVSAEDGQPVEGIALAFGPLAPDGRRLKSWRAQGVHSNARGEFHLDGVSAGKYGIFVNPDQENGVISEIEVCEVRESDVQGVELQVRPGNSINGKVVIEGTSDPAVLANITQIQLSFSTRADEFGVPVRSRIMVNPEGSFHIRGLQPGEIEIQLISAPGFSLLRLERDGTSVLPQEGLPLASGENIANLRVIVGYSRGEGK